MANINQFTSQSGWVNAYSISVPTITTAVPDLVEINYIANNLIVNSLYNFESILGKELKPLQDGIYLVNLCLSTKGATSDVLNISCKYDDVFSKSKLIYSNNHGEMTNVNFGTIIKVTAKDNGYSSFRFFLSNTGRSREELFFTTFNLSIIKLY